MANYLKGYTIKPKSVSTFGTVVFTDGENDCNANQQTCEAYGYSFDKSRGVCQAYLPQNAELIESSNLNLQNSRSGVENTVDQGSFFNDINGVRNEIKQGVQNSLICGEYNQITDNIFDAAVKGKYGKILRQGEQMYGGGNPTFPTFSEPPYGCGYFQSSTIHLTGETTDTVPIVMKVLGVDDIILQTNCVLGFDVRFTSLDQITGDYLYYKKRGTIVTDNDNEATISEVDLICSSGEICDNTFTLSQVSETKGEYVTYGNVQMTIQGCGDNDTVHHATMDIHETRTNTTI